MRGAAKALVLALLLLLKPACGSGGGGSSVPPASGPITLPAVVSSLPLAATAVLPINVTGMSDSAVQTTLQNIFTIGGQLVLHNNGTPRTIVLTTTLDMPSTAASPKAVILDGSGDITLSGNNLIKILDLHDKAQLTVQRMKFINANTPDSGAAINSTNTLGQVTLINCSFTNCNTTNTGPDIGGGAVRLWNGSHTQISGCTFDSCTGSNGGAVDSLGTRLTIINSTFTNNSAFGTGGGQDAIPAGSGQGGIGGAVYVDNVSNDPSALHQLSVTGCTFSGNQANDSAGALFGYTNPAAPSTTIIDRCTFSTNKVNGGHGNAGAIYGQGGTLTLSNSTLNNNQATSNGGGLNSINDSSLIANCTFQSNTAQLGGGFATGFGNHSFYNVTMAQNAGSDFAGAIFALGATVTVWNSILSANTGVNAAAGTQVNNSFGGGANVQAPVGNKPVSSSGTTMVADAMLGALANNGGTTLTRRPSAASAAIDLAGVSGAPLLDQAGNPRNRAPDAGACEGP
jgi:hypothetical protein